MHFEDWERGHELLIQEASGIWERQGNSLSPGKPQEQGIPTRPTLNF